MQFARFSRVLSPSLWLLLLAACSHQPPAKRYELDGSVVAVDAAAHQLTIAHQAVPGLMEAMTMPFRVGENDTWVFRAIAPGDQVHATLVMSDHPELQDINFSKSSDSAGYSTTQIHIPQAGESVPEIKLTNQSGAKLDLRQFRGKPLLLTFIYTRCPFPDYCVRMSHNFEQVLQDLQKDSRAFANAQLLSISIDPEHDKPAELRTYGESYVGRIDPGFQHWQFASGSPDEIRKAANFFGLSYNSKDGQIVHSLSTVLIGPDGKVLKFYSGNGWEPQGVAADFAAAAETGRSTPSGAQ